MTKKEKFDLMEYRYRKYDRLNDRVGLAYTNLQRFNGYTDNYKLAALNIAVIERDMFVKIMHDIWEILDFKE